MPCLVDRCRESLSARGPGWRGWTAVATAGGVAFAMWVLRHGTSGGFDSVSYWSAAHQVKRGRFGQTGLVPAFSDLDYTAILDGSAPLVDFPVGYPLLVGLIGMATGVVVAQQVLVVAAVAAIAGLVMWGPTRPISWADLVTRFAAAWLVAALPIAVLTQRSLLPEPLFVALVIAFCLALLRMRRHGSAIPCGVIGGAAGAIRFVGLPLVILLVIEARRSKRPLREMAISAAACVLPGAINAWWAASVTNRPVRLLSLTRFDVDYAAHSIAGWFTSYLTSLESVLSPDWTVPIAYVLVAAAAGLFLIARVFRWAREPDRTGAELPHVVAASLLATVVLTVISYDALTTFEMRLLYPSGALVAVGFAWRQGARRPINSAMMVIWALMAAGPWAIPSVQKPDDTSLSVAALKYSPAVIVSTSADVIHRQTGIPAAYLPSSTFIHSELPRPRETLMDALPCAMANADGIVLIGGGYLPVDSWTQELFDRQAVQGRWIVDDLDGIRILLPSDDACARDPG